MSWNHLVNLKLDLQRHTELLEVCDWSEEALNELLEKTNNILQDLGSCFFMIENFKDFENIIYQ